MNPRQVNYLVKQNKDKNKKAVIFRTQQNSVLLQYYIVNSTFQTTIRPGKKKRRTGKYTLSEEVG